MARTNTSAESLTAFLDRGSRFEGTLSFQGSVRIDGIFEGDIVSGNTLVLGEQAEVKGTVTVDEVIISGSFAGTVMAANRIAIKQMAKVQADLKTPSLAIEEGAVFNGTISMGQLESSGKKDTRTDAEIMVETIAKNAS